MSFAIIRGKIREVDTYATKEQAVRALGGVDVWIVHRVRFGRRTVERIIPAVRNQTGGSITFRNEDGSEEVRNYWHTTYPTFAAAKANRVREAYVDLKAAEKGLRDSKAELRQARAHRKPKRGRK